jgi:hypothetical protein
MAARRWWGRWRSIAVLALIGVSLSSPPPARAVSLTRGPYLQLLGTTSVTIVWQTDGVQTCGLGIRPVDGETRRITGVNDSRCRMTIDDLSPGTRYAYVPFADDQPLESETIFVTDGLGGPFTFLVFGDSGRGTAAQFNVRDRMLDSPADFVLHVGDMVYPNGEPENFNPRVFQTYREMMRRIVLWPCLGNHDVITNLGQPWRDAFFTPANNASGTENYYSFDYGNAHVVVLDTNASTAPATPQYAFVNADLTATQAVWKIVVFHYPMYSSGRRGSFTDIRDELEPLFDAHAVDLVFAGHDHVYERTRPMRGGQVVTPDRGRVYFVTGGGGAGLVPVGISRFTAYSESAYHFLRVSIDGPSLRGEMIRDDGAIRDTFSIVKSAVPTPTTSTTLPQVVTPCTSQFECDDGAACTIDLCTLDFGCRHDPIGYDTVRTMIARSARSSACDGLTLPPRIARLVGQAGAMVEQARARRRPSILVKRARRKLRRGARFVAHSRRAGLVPAACADDLQEIFRSVPFSCLLRKPSPNPGFR